MQNSENSGKHQRRHFGCHIVDFLFYGEANVNILKKGNGTRARICKVCGKEGYTADIMRHYYEILWLNNT